MMDLLIVNRIDPLYAYKFDPPSEQKKETILNISTNSHVNTASNHQLIPI